MVLSLVAPAGFGKTTFLRQFFGAEFSSCLCECAGVRDDVDLAQRLLPELRDVLEDGSRSAADRLAVALERFAASERTCVVFDSAEAIARNPAATQFFTKLLAHRPKEMRIAVSSREAFPVRFTRFVPPHQFLALRARDFAFDAEELRHAFSGLLPDGQALERIAQLSIGWPIAVFLLKRIAGEGRLEDVTARIERYEFEELHEYVADEILGAFDERTLRSLFVCASIPDATARDVRDAYDDGLSDAELDELARESPFVSREDDAYCVHPLVSGALREHQHERRRALVARLATMREDDGDYVRQAELLLSIDDERAAGAALARFDEILNAAPPERYRSVLRRLDYTTVLRYPRLWAVSALARLYCVSASQLCDEGESIWRTLDRQTPLPDRYVVFILRILLLAYTGRGAEAEAEADAFSQMVPPDSPLAAHLAFLRAFVYGRNGRTQRSLDEINRALPFARSGDLIAAAAHVTLAADIARVRGDRMEEQFITLALQLAEETALPNLIGLVLAHRLVAAWLQGDEVSVGDVASRLEVLVQNGVANFAYVTACALGREAEPSAVDLPEFVIYGHLIALQRSHDDGRRMTLARKAHDVAVRLGVPFLETLAAIAVACCEDLLFEQYRTLAEEASRRVESPPLQEAVRAVFERANDAGMLTGFLKQVRHAHAHAAPIEIGMWSGRVHVDGKLVALGGRELELLFAIAMRREPASRARLASQLWPDLDETAARNALSVCLHRLRGRLKRHDAIERDGDGYRVHAYASVTLWRLERAASFLRGRGALPVGERAMLERLWEELCEEQSPVVAQWEWFEPSLRRLREASVDLAHRLGFDALARGKSLAALWHAEWAMTKDACDETACEIAIRAHLALGERSSAMRTFRRYRDALKSELAAEPSKSLAELLAP